MLQHCGFGFGTIVLWSLLKHDGLLAHASAASFRSHPHAKARSAIFIFQGGGPSQVDTLDPKPLLQKLHGQDVPESIGKSIPKIARSPLNNLLASPWKFRPYGESGITVSELHPELGRCVDDLCVIRSCQHDSPIHAPAEFIATTGTQVGDRPSLGAWLNYGLGSENSDLPGFVVFKTGETIRPPAIGTGFLPAQYQGVLVDSEKGIPNLALPPGFTRENRESQLRLLDLLNREHLARSGKKDDGFRPSALSQRPDEYDSQLEARIKSYELAFRMQTKAPAIFDLSQETPETQSLYGIDQKETAEYGRICLLTRRLVERGVRFIQIRSGGWDSHSDIVGEHTKKCRAIDKPLAALLTDLKRRGLLDETLVVCGGEFGRTPTSQRGATKPGRDHSPSGYTTWLAGGGVRGGQIIGKTDDVGYAAIERPVHPNDLHATILQALGLDQHELIYERHNRREIVTVNGGKVVQEVFGKLGS
jgi:hypothetical protein